MGYSFFFQRTSQKIPAHLPRTAKCTMVYLQSYLYFRALVRVHLALVFFPISVQWFLLKAATAQCSSACVAARLAHRRGFLAPRKVPRCPPAAPAACVWFSAGGHMCFGFGTWSLQLIFPLLFSLITESLVPPWCTGINTPILMLCLYTVIVFIIVLVSFFWLCYSHS